MNGEAHTKKSRSDREFSFAGNKGESPSQDGDIICEKACQVGYISCTE